MEQPRELEIVRGVMAYLDANVENAPRLTDLSAHLNISQFHLQRTFKRLTGLTPREYAEARRMDCLKAQLRVENNVAHALYSAGYGSSSRLYERLGQLGMTPAEYQRGGAGMEIVYTIVNCVLGRLLVAMTERGVCAVHLGDRESAVCDEELEALLHAEYPLATFYPNRQTFYNWVEEIVQHINCSAHFGKADQFDIPLDIRATTFQLRVWNELRKIPYGETRTYGDIARALGQPNAASAVAGAVNFNPVAILIPCHRAERQDGEVTNYYDRRSKLARETMLAHERNVHSRVPADD